MEEGGQCAHRADRGDRLRNVALGKRKEMEAKDIWALAMALELGIKA